MSAIDHHELLRQARAQRERVRMELICRCGEARGEVFLAQLLGESREEREDREFRDAAVEI